MKHPLALPVLASITCLAAWDADARPASAAAHADKAKPAVELHAAKAKSAPPAKLAKAKPGAKLAKEPVADEKDPPKEKAAKKKGHPSYWLAADPHVPLAVVDERGELLPAGDHHKICGSASIWAKPKSRWNAVNEWGQLAGAFQVAGSELDDATTCREISFEGQKTGQPAALFVAEQSGFIPTASVEWKPSEPEKKRFDRFVGGVQSQFLDGKLAGRIQPLARRTMFFEVQPKDSSAAKKRAHWAVTGGPILLVAFVGEHGKWKIARAEPPLGAAQSYKPVAVFDLNGDGVPEIVYHVQEGLQQREEVLSLDPATMHWDDAVNSLDTPAL